MRGPVLLQLVFLRDVGTPTCRRDPSWHKAPYTAFDRLSVGAAWCSGGFRSEHRRDPLGTCPLTRQGIRMGLCPTTCRRLVLAGAAILALGVVTGGRGAAADPLRIEATDPAEPAAGSLGSARTAVQRG